MKLTRFELEVMDVLWRAAPSSIREVQEGLPKGKQLAYTTVQTIFTRLEAKGAVRRVRRVGNAHLFEPVVTRGAAQRRLVDDFLALLGGTRPLMAHLLETGRLSLEDLHAIEASMQPASEEPPPRRGGKSKRQR